MCVCRMCLSMIRLTDGDYSHEFIVTHAEMDVNTCRRVCDSIVGGGQRATKKRCVRPYEIR